MSEKKPRFFYYDEGIRSWCPVPELVEDLVDAGILDNDEILEVKFKRCDMTDEEFANISEV